MHRQPSQLDLPPQPMPQQPEMLLPLTESLRP